MADIDRDNEQFNQGVQHVVELLAKTLGVEDWVAGDGTEDYDDDLQQTLLNILEAKQLYDADTGAFCSFTKANLNPCPFCGSEPHLHEHGHVLPDSPSAFRVECEGKCHAMTCYWHTAAEAVAAWNGRANASREITDRLERLEKWAHEPYDFSHLVQRIEALEASR